jgi:hypothetical protein
MTIRFSSGLLALASDFTGRFAPWQGVSILPHDGGVLVSSSDRGAATFLGWDPNGLATEEGCFLVSKELATAARGIKTATREVSIDGDLAVVTTYRKQHSTSVSHAIARSSQPMPCLRSAMTKAVTYWGSTPEVSATAGRYDLGLFAKAIKTLAGEAESVVLSAFQGGPLRLQREDMSALVLLMPQEAKPIPPVPPWVKTYAAE